MGITEVAFLPLQVDKTLNDPTTADAKCHSSCLDILLAQQGCQRVNWGLEVENPSHLLWFVDWDKLADHIKFTKADVFQSLIGQFGEILGGAPSAYHVEFKSHPSTAAVSVNRAPVVEFVTIWVPTTYSQEDKDKVEESMATFISMFEKEAKNYKGSATGWAEEEIDIPGTDEKAKAFVLLVGWTSVKAHQEFAETQVFKDNIRRIMGTKDMKRIEAVHTSFKEATS